MRLWEMWKYAVAVSLALFCLLLGLALLSAETYQPPEEAPAEIPEEPVETLATVGLDHGFTVRVLDAGVVMGMPLSDYLQSVVRAEMPAAFAQEALCAQAVAARTYTLYKLCGGSKHPDADVCTDAACCQAYRSAAQAAEDWGSAAAQNEEKIRHAVSSTDGQIMVYGGEPILAVFHAAAPGQTRRAGEVWSSDLPYLQSVSSPENGETVPEYYSRVEVEQQAFREIFLKAHPAADFTGDPENWIAGVTGSAGSAHVDTVVVGGVPVRGVEVRQLYGLRSAAFEAEVQGGNIVFYVTGYGHGVGMSQYGANEMAKTWASWREILRHYYTGVEFGMWDAQAGAAV